MVFVLIYLLISAMMLLMAACGTILGMDRQMTTLQRQLDVERDRNAAADSVIARRNHVLGISAEPFSRN